MLKEIDVRGLSCPQPAFFTKQAIDEGHSEFRVLTDDAVARDNVRRMGKNNDYEVTVRKQGDEFIMRMSKS